jgi:hypothetical protein
MKRMTRFALCGIIVACLQIMASAEKEKQEPKTTISGFGYFMFGQIVSGVAGDVFSNSIAHFWQNIGGVNFTVTSQPTDWFLARAGLEMQTYYPIQFAAMDKASYYVQFQGFLPQAEGIFHWKFDKAFLSSLNIESGVFQYTFNPEVKNLGNYLYRSTAIPLSVQSKIDYPWANLMGVRVQTGLFNDKVNIEAILNSEYKYPPWYDWSLGFTASYAPNKVIDVGAGICFAHEFNAAVGTLSDSLDKLWKATKFDARVIFDPKPLFGDPRCFGSEDLKFYSEAAVLGLRDTQEYPYIPSNRLLHRIPFLVGVNVPAFRVLDLLSIELEWFNSPYPNDYFGRFDQNSPLSVDITGDNAAIDNYINKDNFKWSIYLKKSISNFEIRTYLANDHSIYKVFKLENLSCFQQTLKRPKDWQWFVELRYNL